MIPPDHNTDDLSVPSEWTLGTALLENASAAPAKAALRFSDHQMNYAELGARACAVAAGLHDRGVRAGDRVVLILENRHELVVSFLASALLGAIAVPLNTFLRGQFLRHQLVDSDPSVLVVDTAGMSESLAHLDQLPSLRHVVLVDQQADEAPAHITIQHFDELNGDWSGASGPSIDAFSPLSILYTSGTTGASKGCVISHGYFMRQALLTRRWLGLDSHDVVMTASPLFHTMGQTTLGAALVGGRTAAYEREFQASTLWADVTRNQATCFLGVGAMAKALLAKPPTPDDRNHSLSRALFFPLAPTDQLAFEERFDVRVLSEIYGQTECVPITFREIGEEPRALGSAGRPSDHLEVQLHDDEGRQVEIGTVGEIVARPLLPHSLFSGYWRRAEATATAWRDLWHHTGDFGRFDNEGTLWFMDRKSDSLRRRGENISSLELEAALLSVEAIAEVAVHAVPSPLGEDDIKACVVIKPDAELTAESFFQSVRTLVPYFSMPRYVEVVDELPRNAMARVMKGELRRRGVTASTWDLEALGLVLDRDHRRGP